LEISLDAKNWYNEIPLGDGDGEFDIIDDAYDTGTFKHKNLMPSELLPVSTLGLSSVSESDLTDLQMIRGKLTNSVKLSEMIVMDETQTNSEQPDYPGYIAFDVFLKNSSKVSNSTDVLQLNFDSLLEIMPSALEDPTEAADDEAARAATGLQNTARVAFALYGGSSNITDVMADQEEILTATNGAAITDVAIWEPNSNDHVENIVTNNNKIKWKSTDPLYNKQFTTTTQMPTYAVSESVIGVEDLVIADVYDWSGTNAAYIQKQIALQTTKKSETDYTISEGVQNLISVLDTTGETTFAIPSNCVCKMRVYVWLEGQDVDCINYASHGGGIVLNIGLVKGSTPGTFGEADDE